MGRVLSPGLRAIAPALARAEDAPAELLALIWGPRFDRQHARQLAAPLPPALERAADRFDGLSVRQQQRLRRLASGAPLDHNAACRASC